MVEVALEETLVGQHGDGVRAGSLVASGDLDGLEILGDDRRPTEKRV